MSPTPPVAEEQQLEVDPIVDPPPPYPSRARRHRRRQGQASATETDHDGNRPEPHFHLVADDANENTPLLAPPSPQVSTRRAGRPRSNSSISSTSAAPSLTHTVFSLFQLDTQDDLESEYNEDFHDEHYVPAESPLELRRKGWSLFSARVWKKYFRVMTQKAYWAPLFHLMVFNFPYALVAWVYLFVFTLTGTALLIALPLGAVLCFLDLLGARAFARGELALQSTFHGPLAYPRPYPPHPLFRRPRLPTSAETEAGISGPLYEHSFYKNTYAMFTDSTSYQALFYFLVIKPSITLILSLLLVTVVPVCIVLILPAPAILRAVRRLGIWQANIAVEGLYLATS